MTDRVLVTGAAGFIGSHVSEALVQGGTEVVGIDNFDPLLYPRAAKERNLAALRTNGRFRFVEGDIARDPLPIDGCSVVVHLAAKAGVRPSLADPVAYTETNVIGTARVLDVARRAGVRRVVFASSSSVYGDTTAAPFAEDAPAVEPISPYGATKRAGELLAFSCAAHFGLRIACLRFFTVYGPRQRPDLAIHTMTALTLRGQPVLMFGDGSSARDYTYISDAVAGVLAALEWTGRGGPEARVFNIGGGAPVRLDRMMAVLGEALGRPLTVERRPDQPGDVRLTAADMRRARAELGYQPAVKVDEGIRHFVRWYEEVHGRQR